MKSQLKDKIYQVRNAAWETCWTTSLPSSVNFAVPAKYRCRLPNNIAVAQTIVSDKIKQLLYTCPVARIKIIYLVSISAIKPESNSGICLTIVQKMDCSHSTWRDPLLLNRRLEAERKGDHHQNVEKKKREELDHFECVFFRTFFAQQWHFI